MPHVIVKLQSGRSEQQKAKITEEVTKAIMASANCAEQSVSVGIEDVEPGDCNCSPLDRSVHPDCMIGTPASAARRASIAVRPCNRPVAMTLAAAA